MRGGDCPVLIGRLPLVQADRPDQAAQLPALPPPAPARGVSGVQEAEAPEQHKEHPADRHPRQAQEGGLRRAGQTPD